MADIVEGSGAQITTYAAEGKRDPTQVSKWNWPTLPYSPSAAWKKWRGTIEHSFLKNGLAIPTETAWTVDQRTASKLGVAP